MTQHSEVIYRWMWKGLFWNVGIKETQDAGALVSAWKRRVVPRAGPRGITRNLLPSKLQRELNLPRCRIHLRNRTGGRPIYTSVEVENGAIVIRRIEIRPIQDIEELRSKLRFERLMDRDVLEQGKIHID